MCGWDKTEDDGILSPTESITFENKFGEITHVTWIRLNPIHTRRLHSCLVAVRHVV